MQNPHELEGQLISAVKDFANSVNTGNKVVADMSSLVAVTSKLPLSNLDYWERLIRYEFSCALESSSQPKWKIWSKRSEILTWLDLISWDGFKRERTLRTIKGAAPNSFFFALAIRRLNDWVPEVREAAREKLPLIVHESDSAHIVDALCATLSHWSSWGRIGESEKQGFLETISNRDVREALKFKLMSSASGPMTHLFTQIARVPALDEYLAEIATTSVQPSLRAKAYRSLFEERMVWVEGRKWEWTDIRYCIGRLKPIVSERKLKVTVPFLEVMANSSIDRSSAVRRVAAEFLIQRIDELGEDSLRLAKLFSIDKSPSVSERGKFALKRLGDHKVWV